MLRTVRSGPSAESRASASLGPKPLAPSSRWKTCRSPGRSNPKSAQPSSFTTSSVCRLTRPPGAGSRSATPAGTVTA